MDLFVEIPIEVIDGKILRSDIRPATKEDIEKAQNLHRQGHCPHNVVKDERSWLYDYRVCFTCGKGLGAI